MTASCLRGAFSLIIRRALVLGVPLALLASTTPEAHEVPEGIKPGTQVRITAPSVATTRLVGAVASVDSVEVVLIPRGRDLAQGLFHVRQGPSEPPLTVPWATIAEMELRQKKWGGKRMVLWGSIGLLSGAVLGGLIGYASGVEGDVPLGRPGAAFYGALIFGGAGLVLGATIGAFPHEQWQTVPLAKE
jgi:hypothetical protein